MSALYAYAAIASTLATGVIAYHFPNFARGVFTAACLAVIIVGLNFMEHVL